MGKYLVLVIIFAVATVYAVSPDDKDTGRKLACPPIEATELMGTPEAIYEKKNGQLYAECSYFVQTGENKWESVLIVRAFWVEKEAAEQFDCKWEGKEDPFRYIASTEKQAYVHVFTYRRDFYPLTFDVAKNLYDQIVPLARECPVN